MAGIAFPLVATECCPEISIAVPQQTPTDLRSASLSFADVLLDTETAISPGMPQGSIAGSSKSAVKPLRADLGASVQLSDEVESKDDAPKDDLQDVAGAAYALIAGMPVASVPASTSFGISVHELGMKFVPQRTTGSETPVVRVPKGPLSAIPAGKTTGPEISEAGIWQAPGDAESEDSDVLIEDRSAGTVDEGFRQIARREKQHELVSATPNAETIAFSLPSAPIPNEPLKTAIDGLQKQHGDEDQATVTQTLHNSRITAQPPVASAESKPKIFASEPVVLAARITPLEAAVQTDREIPVQTPAEIQVTQGAHDRRMTWDLDVAPDTHTAEPVVEFEPKQIGSTNGKDFKHESSGSGAHEHQEEKAELAPSPSSQRINTNVAHATMPQQDNKPAPAASEVSTPEPLRQSVVAADDKVDRSAPSAQMKHMDIRIPDAHGGVTVRVQERAGELHVSVRSSDAQMAGRIAETLPDLTRQLDYQGFRAETWTPAHESISASEPGLKALESAVGGQADTFQDSSPQSADHRESANQGNHGKRRPEWDEPPPDRKKNEPTEEFKEYLW